MWLLLIGSSINRINTILGMRIGTVVSFVVFSVFAWFGGTLTPRLVFSTLSHLAFLRNSIINFVEGIGFILESRVEYKRMKVRAYYWCFIFQFCYKTSLKFIFCIRKSIFSAVVKYFIQKSAILITSSYRKDYKCNSIIGLFFTARIVS